MDVWAGDIELPGGGAIQGVALVTTRAGGPPLDRISLRFLAVVDVARIPLYLASGPPLEVFTPWDATQDWFGALLLGGHAAERGAEPWWQASMAQSPIGILTEVKREDGNGSGPNVTEILFYATSSGPNATPSPADDDAIHGLKICALPLSSDLLHKIPAVTTPPLSPQLPGFEPDHPSEPAEFLAPLFPTPSLPDPHTRKRQSVSSLFDEAAERRKRARRKGGESISAAAAAAASKAAPPQLPLHQRNRSASTSLGLQELFDPQNHIAPNRPSSADGIAAASNRPLSRSPSLSAAADPQPRKTDSGPAKPRSSLSRVTSAETTTTESRNKDTVSRLVMAGMRMHGLERGGAAATTTTAAAAEAYKLVYHQTYRATLFAVRRHVATTPLALHVERLRETVDKLLAIFCADPLAPPLPPVVAEGVVATPGPEGKTVFGTAAVEGSPFGARGEGLGREEGVSVHTPVTRRSGVGQGG